MERERFSPTELATVLSHYNLGVIRSAKEFPRGSVRSPKIILQTDAGRFLLKRRAAGRGRPRRIRFAHQVMSELARNNFPVPALIRTRQTQKTVLQLGGNAYELFEYRPGLRYDGSLEQTAHAGRMLARFHRVAKGAHVGRVARPGGYHDSDAVREGMNAIPGATSAHDSVAGHEAELLSTVRVIYEHYDSAATAVNELGFGKWSPWVVHGDWHPGNMRFNGNRVSVVLDFDSSRRGAIVTDVANGMLQFSLILGDDPALWPDYFDLARMRRFWLGYDSRIRLATEQKLAIPHLMIESLIAECVVPVAATGSLGEFQGFGALRMVRRKVDWLLRNLEEIRSWLQE